MHQSSTGRSGAEVQRRSFDRVHKNDRGCCGTPGTDGSPPVSAGGNRLDKLLRPRFLACTPLVTRHGVDFRTSATATTAFMNLIFLTYQFGSP